MIVLTKAEEQVMQILWEIEQGFVKDVIAKYEDKKPNYNTVSTIIRILEQKEFIGHKAYGKTHEYFPLISKAQYSNTKTKTLLKDYFGGSLENLVSFFAKENQLSANEVQEMMELVNKKIKN